MKYRVRSPDGELEYESYEQLRDAAASGLVDPGDEIQREDQQEWKKASAIAGLLGATTKRRLWATPLFRWILLAVAAAGFAVWAIHTGEAEKKPELYAIGLVVVFVVAALLFKVTADAQRPRR